MKITVDLSNANAPKHYFATDEHGDVYYVTDYCVVYIDNKSTWTRPEGDAKERYPATMLTPLPVGTKITFEVE